MRFLKSILSFLVLFIISETTSAQTLYDVTVGTDNVTIRDVYLDTNGVSVFQDTGAKDTIPTTNVVTLDSIHH